MIDELATLNKSRDRFVAREDSYASAKHSPNGSSAHPPGTHANVPAAARRPFDETPAPALPPRIGAYLVLSQSGSDDQGRVFRVLHPELGREFVLKLFNAGATDSPAARERIRREGRLVAECRHPNLLEIVDVDLHEGHPFVVTERIQGLPLSDYARERRPGAREAAGLVVELARAVDYIHARGIIHQDLTHSNVLIDETGRPKLIDFGLARLRAALSVDANGPTRSAASESTYGHVTGQFEPVGPATDIFGLGTVLKHVLIWHVADTSSVGASVLEREKNEKKMLPFCPVSPRVPRGLLRICEKATAADQSRRYQSAAELAWDLQLYRSRRWFVWTASVALAVLAARFFAGY